MEQLNNLDLSLRPLERGRTHRNGGIGPSQSIGRLGVDHPETKHSRGRGENQKEEKRAGEAGSFLGNLKGLCSVRKRKEGRTQTPVEASASTSKAADVPLPQRKRKTEDKVKGGPGKRIKETGIVFKSPVIGCATSLERIAAGMSEAEFQKLFDDLLASREKKRKPDAMSTGGPEE